jgi:transcriptional regulator with XRE-family HTH domain
MRIVEVFKTIKIEVPGLGGKIKEARQAKMNEGHTVASIAAAAGMTSQNLHQIEKERHKLPIETLRLIEAALDADFGVVIEGESVEAKQQEEDRGVIEVLQETRRGITWELDRESGARIYRGTLEPSRAPISVSVWRSGVTWKASLIYAETSLGIAQGETPEMALNQIIVRGGQVAADLQKLCN